MIYIDFTSQKKVSKILKISRSTIIKWISKYNNNLINLVKVIDKTHKTPTKKYLNTKNIIKLFIINLYNTNPFYTRPEIAILIQKKFNVKFSLKKLRQIILNLNFTYKKTKYLVVKNRSYINELQLLRSEFIKKNKLIKVDKLIFLDESGFNSLYKKHMKGHSIKGKHLNLPINEKQFKNNSLLMALTVNTILKYSIYNEKVNSNIFFNFIKEIIDNNNIKDYTFVFDNVSFHRKKEVLNLIIESGNFYLFTPLHKT